MESYTIKNLTFSYPEQTKPALNKVSLTIKHGEFITLCGASGCGKTTLLRQLKTVLSPHGILDGEILFEGQPLSTLDHRAQSQKIGFVLQSPDNQIVTDKVWHELAFGLESLGYDTPAIRLRVAEMASFFGIQEWFYQNVSELSGGQKQLLNLASIMVMQPSVLILDEPTSQLDPIAATDFLAVIGRINRELGVTIIMTEHRLEEVLPMSNRVIVIENGSILAEGAPFEVGQRLAKKKHKMFLAMPAPMRIYAGVDNDLTCPVTVCEGRNWLNLYAEKHQLNATVDIPPSIPKKEIEIELNEVWFRYEKNLPDVVRGLSLKVYKGEFLAILGGNGTGKTTALSMIAGLNTPYRGAISLEGQITSNASTSQIDSSLLATLPQNPQALFVKKTVELDLYDMLKTQKLSKEDKATKIKNVAILCELSHLLNRHPYDLSGGEQQRAALAKVLLLNPKILLLDEPTKGLDAEFKQSFAEILNQLLQGGVTIVMVSHDIEFCAKYAHRCAMFFNGEIVSEGTPQEFFCCNNFYTTSANRMARHLIPNAVTDEDVILACGGHIPEKFAPKKTEYSPIAVQKEKALNEKKPIKKRITPAIISAIIFCITVACGFPILRQLTTSGGDLNTAFVNGEINLLQYALIILLLTASVAVFIRSLFQTTDTKSSAIIQNSVGKRKLSKRTLTAMLIILILIPLTIFIGVYYLNDRKYYFISLLIILETFIPFIMIFEGRKPQARELIIIAVLCAIGVAGRGAFFMLPQFKPVIAIVIISGVAFGGETGFLVGAVTGFVSNMFFGQGPWTTWQMFAFGIIGFLAGVLFKKGLLRRNKLSLTIFGGLATFFVFGGIMDPASVLMFQTKPTSEMFELAYLQGIPFNLIHAFATMFFLWLASQPMLEKLDRIKSKYGLVE